MSDYKPVSCDFHDELTAASTRKVEVELTFEMNGELQRQRGKVRDVYTSDGEEFVKLETPSESLELRLDQLKEMNTI